MNTSMNNKLFIIAALVIGSFLTQSCRENVRETEIHEVEVQSPSEAQDDPGILERTGNKIDEEINEEIDKTIDEIGDDN